MSADSPPLDPIFGRLTLDAFPIHEPILVATFAVVVLAGLSVAGALTYFRLWVPLWRDWITTVDHKRIGIMYIVLALIMLLRGFADAVMMRLQQAMAFNGSDGYLPAHHFDQIFTAHGVIMIFFVATPLIVGVMNFVIPLQIGARDVSFPYLNNLGFWLTAVAAILVNVSLFVGEFSQAGWVGEPPLSGLDASPGVGVDYYLWALQISGAGTLIGGINLLATIIKMRAPGMSFMRMPIFCWTSLCVNALIVLSFPFLTISITLLTLDRLIGTHFFTTDLGGNPMAYVNLVWVWGHPEVYILILPALGVFSEVVPVLCGKRLFGYTSMVYATVSITVIGFVVWLHHFFTMGSGASVNGFFGLMTALIAIPTGVKVYNWLFTMYRGRVRMETPMVWTVAFMFTFLLGGLSGVLCSIPALDFQLHNSLVLVAHFHNVAIGAIVFAMMAAIDFWFPKAFGFRLDPFWGRLSAYFWTGGFFVAFMPLYIAGVMGTTRRTRVFDDPSLQIWFIIAAIGSLLIFIGVLCFLIQIYVSIRNREALRDVTGDAWGNGRTLEWSTSSPPPDYNFAFTPVAHDVDAWANMKDHGYSRPLDGFNAVHMPRNTSVGIIVSVLTLIFSFAIVWYMWLVAAVSFGLMVLVSIGHTFNYNRSFHIPADQVARTEGERTRLLAQQG
jgi:cytochrome o ubiquinol oxidase subunit 1